MKKFLILFSLALFFTQITNPTEAKRSVKQTDMDTDEIILTASLKDEQTIQGFENDFFELTNNKIIEIILRNNLKNTISFSTTMEKDKAIKYFAAQGYSCS